LTPDTRIAAVPYALQAERVRGYAGVVSVAKSGGDYTSVQAAIDSITGAAADNPYLVWVAPGVYSETVTMKPYVHLQGAGQEITIITSTRSTASSMYPTEATLMLTRHVSLRDLTVTNVSTDTNNVALLATAGVTEALVANVTARAEGSGGRNYAIFLTDWDTVVTFQDVTALAENGSEINDGLHVSGQAQATLRGGTFTGRGGNYATGISASYGPLEAEGVIAVAENGNSNFGLSSSTADVALRGGSFIGRGGGNAYGISVYYGTLEAEGVTVLGEEASGANHGLANGSATTVLWGGSFTARGGMYAYGLRNRYSGTRLKAEGVTALGEDASTENDGLYNTTPTAEVKADNSQLIGATNAVRQNGGPIKIGVSLLDGGVNRESGTVTCFQVYDGNYAAYTCP
jgi:hypothetical protein